MFDQSEPFPRVAAELWEDEQVRLSLFELRLDVIEILSHFSEQWMILIVANSHVATSPYNNGQGELPCPLESPPD